MENSNKKRGRPAKEKDYNSPFAIRLRELGEGMTHQEIADGVGISRQTVGQFMLGNTQPDIDTLCKLADFFKVSTDYLLCRTNVKAVDTDIQAVCKYTGLSEKALYGLLHLDNLSFYGLEVLNHLLEECFSFYKCELDDILDGDAYFPTILNISEYLSTKPNNDSNSKYYLSANGNIVDISNTDKDKTLTHYKDMYNIANIEMNDLIDKILLDKIKDALKQSKKQFLNKATID